MDASTAFLEQKTSLEEKRTLLTALSQNVQKSVMMLDDCQAAIDAEADRVSLSIHASFQRLIDSFTARQTQILEEVRLHFPNYRKIRISLCDRLHEVHRNPNFSKVFLRAVWCSLIFMCLCEPHN